MRTGRRAGLQRFHGNVKTLIKFCEPLSKKRLGSRFPPRILLLY